MKSTRNTHVAILRGGISSEDYLSRRSAAVVEEALRSNGYRVEVLDWVADGTIRLSKTGDGRDMTSWPSLVHCFADYRPDVVFNTLHGELENAGQVQGFFELAGIPLTGNGITPSVIGMDKVLTKDVFDILSVIHPRDVQLGFPRYDDAMRSVARLRNSGLGDPFMLKLTHGGSSSGLDLIEDEDSFVSTWERWGLDVEDPGVMAFAEEYIDGPEYCVGTFGHWRLPDITILPVAEIEFEGRYFDKNIKFEDRYRVNCGHELAAQHQFHMRRVAIDVHRHLRFVGFSRIDFRIRDDRIYALEVNTHPGLGPSSIIPNSLECSDLTMQEAVSLLVEWSISPP
ncbi:MAG: hypothetical protein MI724_13355 [Spirochaetales bacterium]|nr:hypothetical protein [Spirochaetales bacterium]